MNKKDLYSSFKVAHHLEAIKDLRDGKLILPKQVQLDLQAGSQHSCVFCFYRGVNSHMVTKFNPKDILPYETFIRLIDEMESLGTPAIQLTGGGEPLLYSQIYAAIDHLNTKNIEKALVTNGVLLKEDIIDRMLQFSWIRVSIDAATRKTYAQSQNCSESDVDKAIKNISMAVKKLPNTIIGAPFVINPLNYKEIYNAVLLYKQLGVHNVRLSVAYTKEQNKIFEPFIDEMIDLAREARTLEDENFKVFDLGYTHTVDLEKKKEYSVCGYSHFTAAIEANGSVRPCCTLKALAHSNFGNINTESFSNIWYGQVRREWLEKFNSKYCELCWMEDKNLFIEYLTSKDPMHVNYV